MARGTRADTAQPDRSEIELETRAQVSEAPAIEITDLEPTAAFSDSGSSVILSPTSSVTPGSLHSAPSPQTSISSADVADEAVRNAQQVTESLDGSTLQPSVSTCRSNSTPSPSSITSDRGEDPTPAPQSTWRHLFSTDAAKKVMSLSVVILTIVTVVYSHRSFVLEKWNDLAAYWAYCEDNNDPQCTWTKTHRLPFPPYADDVPKIRPVGETDQSINASTNLTRYLPPIATFFLGTALAGVAWFIVRRRRRSRARQSEHSMVRRHFSAPDAWAISGQGISGGQNVGRRIRAFITMEQAINGIKSANSSESTLTNPINRRSSNPYSKRNSWLTRSDPSIFHHAEFYEYNSEDEKEERWKRVVRKVESTSTFASSAKTLTSSPEELSPPRHRPLPTADGNEAREDEARGFKDKLRRLFTPSPLTIVDPSSPDLDEGDFKAGVAFLGAMLAATTGGGAMKDCPVELPVEPGKLPEHWMPICPQDASGGSVSG